jgi:dynein heavy chain, axonemal
LSHEQTLTNCLITAAYISYLGAFDKDLRAKLCSFFFNTCTKYEIPFEPQYVFKDMTLAEFLYTPIQLKEIKLLRLPDTENILENGCYIIEDKSYDSWPLICDPSRRSIDWIRTYYKDRHIVTARFSEMKSSLETCLSEGQYLLLTDCNVNTLMDINKLEVVLRNKYRFINSEKPFKLNLGSQEVECRPSFRLFLHTIHQAIDVPSELAAYSTVLTYNLTREDVEEEMLDRFMQLAKPRVDTERHALLQEKVDTLKIIDPLEQDITDFLASDVDLLHNVEPTKKLSDLKKLYDEAVESNLRIETAEEQLIKNRESFRDIAVRASVCYDVISTLKEINLNYVILFSKFVELFNESLYQFERSSVPQVISKFTTSVYNTAVRLMNENDKKVFGILLALEIETSFKRVNPGEKDFIISPSYGAAVMQSITGKQATDHKYWQVKKPFDWMQDEQFLNLQVIF